MYSILAQENRISTNDWPARQGEYSIREIEEYLSYFSTESPTRKRTSMTIFLRQPRRSLNCMSFFSNPKNPHDFFGIFLINNFVLLIFRCSIFRCSQSSTNNVNTQLSINIPNKLLLKTHIYILSYLLDYLFMLFSQGCFFLTRSVFTVNYVFI